MAKGLPYQQPLRHTTNLSGMSRLPSSPPPPALRAFRRVCRFGIALRVVAAPIADSSVDRQHARPLRPVEMIRLIGAAHAPHCLPVEGGDARDHDDDATQPEEE